MIRKIEDIITPYDERKIACAIERQRRIDEQYRDDCRRTMAAVKSVRSGNRKQNND